MDAQVLGVRVPYLVHHVGQVKDYGVFASAHTVGHHFVLVFAQLLGQNADGVVFVDDRRFGWNDTVFKQEFRTEAVHVADKHVCSTLVANALGYSFGHASCGTIGERQANHLVVVDAVLMRIDNALGQHLRLSASRRRQHEIVPACSFNDLLLVLIELNTRIAVFHFEMLKCLMLCKDTQYLIIDK